MSLKGVIKYVTLMDDPYLSTLLPISTFSFFTILTLSFINFFFVFSS